ncbi:hypothetical protein KJY77_00030 [Canibacter sp. lx-72]|uniref:hypothetical protein n=1 Tax=Canibacter zhuwentaonis TaxID=2837491 RepID=UPI001BDCFC5A|nr:hypothetical protein [Canibacter zhuwentaonis]MBT1017535.1 hypothetical protein [Canibacter zhuwentaonis]MBT1034746.1 hypothetical protein [Canibacter zhuwentaonis]
MPHHKSAPENTTAAATPATAQEATIASAPETAPENTAAAHTAELNPQLPVSQQLAYTSPP